MFDLASYLPYLVNRTGVRLAEAFSAELESFSITLPMWRVVAALDHKPRQRVGELAEMTSIEVSTLSRLLGSMERKGLVERERNYEDARTVTVDLTDLGERVTHQIIPLAKSYEELALSEFSAEEAAALKEMLIRVFRNLDSLEIQAETRTKHSA